MIESINGEKGTRSKGDPLRRAAAQSGVYSFTTCASRKVGWGPIVMRVWGALMLALLLGACARGQAVRTSANTMIVQTSAAAVCGGQVRLPRLNGLLQSRPFERDTTATSSRAAKYRTMVRVSHLPGTYNTEGTYGCGSYQANHDLSAGRDNSVGLARSRPSYRDVHDGEAGAQQAVSAREVLGRDWEEKIKKGVNFCF